MRQGIVKFSKVVGLTAAISGALIGILAVLRWTHLSINEFLAIPKAVITWPVAAAVLGLVLLLRFSGAIDHVIRYGRFSLPGGIEIQSQTPTEEEVTTPPPGVTLTPEQQEELGRFVQSLQQQHHDVAAQLQEARTRFERALRNGVLWEFRYLDLFFVPHTKQVLAWLAQFPGLRRNTYDTIWQQLIPDTSERETVMDVLLAHEVVREGEQGTLNITPKGLAFLEFLGVPPRPVPHPPGG